VNGNFYVQVAIWSQVVSAVFFIACLVLLWVRVLQPMVLAAQDRSNRQIAEAERHRDEAKASLDALKGEIESANRDAELIRERAQRQGERERHAALAEANVEGQRALRNAEGELERARESARTRLRAKIAGRALDVARDEAQRRIDTAINAKIVARFLTSLESASK
jgi:F0F1-type ATP synthase membrane subunit b/b'